jgi:hypothetical protein
MGRVRLPSDDVWVDGAPPLGISDIPQLQIHLVGVHGGGHGERWGCRGVVGQAVVLTTPVAFCPPDPALLHRRFAPSLVRNLGGCMFRSRPSCIAGSFQKKACPAWGRRLKESRSNGRHLLRGRRSGADLSSERFRVFPWPMSHSGKFPAVSFEVHEAMFKRVLLRSSVVSGGSCSAD